MGRRCPNAPGEQAGFGAANRVQRGVVKWFDSRMGYGFVIDAEGRDVFLHRRILRQAGRRKLEPGEIVEYEVETTPRGNKITRLIVLDRPSTASQG